MKDNILISACLLGLACRYDGKEGKRLPFFRELSDKYNLIPVCPEIYGGLPTPRNPSEIQRGGVFMNDGTDVSENYKRGAEAALSLAKLYNCKVAVLKRRSPSCGFGEVYDGTFSSKLKKGNGITAELLAENGILIYGEDNAELLI